MAGRSAYLDPRPAEAMRVAPRRLVRLDALLSSSATGRMRAEVVNISRLGCRVDLACRLVAGGFVIVRLPGLEPIGSRIAWSRWNGAGLAFGRPLAAAVLDRLLGAHPADAG